MEEKRVLTDLSREELIEYATVLESGIGQIMLEVNELIAYNEELRELVAFYQSTVDMETIARHRETTKGSVM